MKNKRKLIIFIIFLFLLVTIPIFLYTENNILTISEYNIENKLLSNDFNNYKILQISDLHNKEFGKNHKKTISKIEDIAPDLIVITGDLIDSYNTNIDKALSFVEFAINYAPIYYVNGNHEARISNYKEFKDKLISLGVNVLENELVEIKSNDSYVNLIGLSDPDFGFSETYLSNSINKDRMNIVLSHRPELFDTYVNYSCDLVLSGHAHGGQIRIPIIGGLVAPHQGLLPKYDAGVYEKEGTKMIVSRGLGNSIFPFRIFNRPELVVVNLKSGR